MKREKSNLRLRKGRNRSDIPDNTRGTYALVVHLANDCTIEVGSLGRFEFMSGFYVYIGSAFGPGGVAARINHHLRKSDRPWWHIDYLRRASTITAVLFCRSEFPVEHQWAAVVAQMNHARIPVSGFGSSDCECPSHLCFFSRKPGNRSLISHLENNGGCRRVFVYTGFYDHLSVLLTN
jgi:Uri superfamily endonuclease